jgi:hypothetical protein
MSSRQRIVVESPLLGDSKENLRYLLWCCRAAYLAGYAPIASHLVCPWFMNDQDAKERADGFDCPWMWTGSRHLFFVDLGMSDGMSKAKERCKADGLKYDFIGLAAISPNCWAAYQRGGWPPATEGFQVA